MKKAYSLLVFLLVTFLFAVGGWATDRAIDAPPPAEVKKFSQTYQTYTISAEEGVNTQTIGNAP